jgi:hypothetical protein
MKFWFSLLLFAAALGMTAAAQARSYTITAEMWMQPRSGQVMLQMPPVHEAVQDWMKHPGSKLVILHSGDEIGSLWASEVQDWLVSLGIPSADITKQVSGQDENSVTLAVEP